jgi:hypothetical protein
MTRFIQNSAVSCTVHTKKKKEKDLNGAVLNGIMGLLLPLDARSRGRRRFFFLCFPPPFLSQNDTDQPHLPKTTFHVLEGQQHNGRPNHVPPLFLPIKTGGKTDNQKRDREGGKRDNEKERRREERGQSIRGKELKTERKKRTKNRGEREKKKNRVVATTANRQCHHQRRYMSPQAAPPTTAATAGQPVSPSFFFGFIPAMPPLFT